jgi:hypothetical protein
MYLKRFLSAVALTLCAGPVASAAVSYSYVADSSSYTGPAGGTAAVSIYLQETLTSPSTSFIVAQGGVTTAGAAVNVVGTTDGSAAQIANQSFAIPSAFAGPDEIVYNQGGNDLEFNESIALNAPAVEPTDDRILLGVVDVTVGTGITTYQVTSLRVDTIPQGPDGLGGVDGNTTTPVINKTYFDLDATSPGLYTGADEATPFEFTVAAPEPASWAGLFVAAAALPLRRPRMRRCEPWMA